MGVHLMGVRLIGVHLIGMHLSYELQVLTSVQVPTSETPIRCCQHTQVPQREQHCQRRLLSGSLPTPRDAQGWIWVTGSVSPSYRDRLSIGEDITVSSMMLFHVEVDL
jgi:hypothetical protein